MLHILEKNYIHKDAHVLASNMFPYITQCETI